MVQAIVRLTWGAGRCLYVPEDILMHVDPLPVDGALGTVNQFLSDDQQCTIRFLVANIGGYALGQQVLIPISAHSRPDWKGQAFDVTLT
jgi:hypothetical protein